MKKVFLVLTALVLLAVSVTAFAEEAAGTHNFATYTSNDGTVYDLFAITKMNYGADHKVTSVTGRFQRVVIDPEDGEYPEESADSEVTLNLAPDFTAQMFETANDLETPMITVTDLYAWYVSAYCGGEENLEGRELVFQCDLPESEQADAEYDFWFVTVKIEVNEQNEIVYMENAYVPWA